MNYELNFKEVVNTYSELKRIEDINESSLYLVLKDETFFDAQQIYMGKNNSFIRISSNNDNKIKLDKIKEIVETSIEYAEDAKDMWENLKEVKKILDTIQL